MNQPIPVASTNHTWTYPGNLKSVTDGDTLHCDVRLSYELELRDVRVRVEGINSPEMNTPEGKAARDYAVSLLPVGTPLLFKHRTRDNYGRFLAVIYLPDGQSFGALMIAAGHAVLYPAE